MGSPLAHTTGDQPCSLAKKRKEGEEFKSTKKERRKGGNLFFFVFLVSSSSCISYSLGPLPRPSVLICRQRKRKRRGAMRQGRKGGGGVLIPEDQGRGGIKATKGGGALCFPYCPIQTTTTTVLCRAYCQSHPKATRAASLDLACCFPSFLSADFPFFRQRHLQSQRWKGEERDL